MSALIARPATCTCGAGDHNSCVCGTSLADWVAARPATCTCGAGDSNSCVCGGYDAGAILATLLDPGELDGPGAIVSHAEVLAEYARGSTQPADIAAALGVSVSTVRRLLRSLTRSGMLSGYLR